MSQTQLEAALNMLPKPGDDVGLSRQKMDQVQTVLDPLRKQLPTMPGASLIPTFRESAAYQQA